MAGTIIKYSNRFYTPQLYGGYIYDSYVFICMMNVAFTVKISHTLDNDVHMYRHILYKLYKSDTERDRNLLNTT